MQYRYSIVTKQQGHITHVDGAWVGQLAATAPGALESCPRDIDWINQAGQDGWRVCLLEPIGQPGSGAVNLYLERIISTT